MNSVVVRRVDPSIVVSLAAAAVLVTLFTSSTTVGRMAHQLVQAGWLYLSNTRG